MIKQHKFSIRKFAVGQSSIVIGGIIFLSGHEDVSAEQHSQTEGYTRLRHRAMMKHKCQIKNQKSTRLTGKMFQRYRQRNLLNFRRNEVHRNSNNGTTFTKSK